jgi:hypothetical protein
MRDQRHVGLLGGLLCFGEPFSSRVGSRMNTFRTVYTVRFAKAVYVLHAFQKKSRRAIATPKGDLDLIGARLTRAKEDYEAWLKSR